MSNSFFFARHRSTPLLRCHHNSASQTRLKPRSSFSSAFDGEILRRTPLDLVGILHLVLIFNVTSTRLRPQLVRACLYTGASYPGRLRAECSRYHQQDHACICMPVVLKTLSIDLPRRGIRPGVVSLLIKTANKKHTATKYIPDVSGNEVALSIKSTC
ncbi:hypothetical protein FB451DRAFT_660255 [Mycena latifolia]|nr:hypothetical protein FB451DRAFT_660255 [Mycena latifolia]